MKRSPVPFNIELLNLTPAMLVGVPRISSLAIYDNNTGEFHPEGLFSIFAFGPVGSNVRSQRFGHIDIKLKVFHPVLYKAIVDLKGFYGEIISGKRFAIWDKAVNDFVPSDAIDGQTGMAFFLSHWDEIEFVSTQSDKREEKIKLIERYRKSALTDKIIVIPAGMRDLEVAQDGRAVVDEINEFYNKFIRTANTIPESAIRNNPESVDSARFQLQQNFNALYSYIENIIKGKKKLFMSSFLSRRIHDGTRNVLTALIPTTSYLGEKGTVTLNNTLLGIYQFSVALGRVSRFHLQNEILGKAFIDPNTPARLIDRKTLEQVEVDVDSRTFDYYQTVEGLDKLVQAFGHPDTRHKPVIIEGHYLALVYKGENSFKVFYDIRELPPGYHRKDVKPITFVELVYLSLFRVINRYPVYMTRYPVEGPNSIYPSLGYVKTTVQAEKRWELNDNWEFDDNSEVALEYPVYGATFYDSVTPHMLRIAGMGGDYDGDTGSVDAGYTEESVEETHRYLRTRGAYVAVNGKFRASTSIPPIEIVMYNLTGD